MKLWYLAKGILMIKAAIGAVFLFYSLIKPYIHENSKHLSPVVLVIVVTISVYLSHITSDLGRGLYNKYFNKPNK